MTLLVPLTSETSFRAKSFQFPHSSSPTDFRFPASTLLI